MEEEMEASNTFLEILPKYQNLFTEMVVLFMFLQGFYTI